MDAYRTINDTLVNLFNEIWELEKEAIITEEFKDITNNDMHIIEAIGLSGENTMSSVAKKLKITAHNCGQCACQKGICEEGKK
jgi:DNA-binding MarR family transcriptional regulator